MISCAQNQFFGRQIQLYRRVELRQKQVKMGKNQQKDGNNTNYLSSCSEEHIQNPQKSARRKKSYSNFSEVLNTRTRAHASNELFTLIPIILASLHARTVWMYFISVYFIQINIHLYFERLNVRSHLPSQQILISTLFIEKCLCDGLSEMPFCTL